FPVEGRYETDSAMAISQAGDFITNKSNGAAVVICNSPHALAVDANRHTNVRAAAVSFGGDARKIIEEVKANLLTVAVAAAGSGQIVAMVKAMCPCELGNQL